MGAYRYRTISTRGITAVEMLVGVSIVALVLVFVMHAVTRFVSTGRDIADKTQALYLAEGGLELTELVRDKAWNNIGGLTNGSTYYLAVKPASVTVTTTPETIGMFTRSFTVEPVERGSGDDIVSSGTADPNSKYVTVTVSWGTPEKSVTLTSLLANISNP